MVHRAALLVVMLVVTSVGMAPAAAELTARDRDAARERRDLERISRGFGLKKGALVGFRSDTKHRLKVVKRRKGAVDVVTVAGDPAFTQFLASTLARATNRMVYLKADSLIEEVTYFPRNRATDVFRDARINLARGVITAGKPLPLLRQVSRNRDRTLVFELLPGVNRDAAMVLATRLTQLLEKKVVVREKGKPEPTMFAALSPTWIPSHR